MICFFCGEDIEASKIARIEDIKGIPASGYCYCIDCLASFKTGLDEIFSDIDNLVHLGLERGEATSLVCFGSD